MASKPAPAGAAASPPTSVALFTGFLMLGLGGFGGVLPMSRHMLVERRRWLDAAEFAELLALCQFLPGGNVVNLSVAVGWRFRGVAGALAALAGLLAAPACIVVALGAIYGRLAGHPLVGRLFAGVAAAAAGLLVALACQLLRPLWPNRRAICIAALCLVLIAGLRLPLVPVLLVLVPASTLLMRKPG